MAIIAISAEGPGLDDALDPRFGGAAGFVVVGLRALDGTFPGNGSSRSRARGAAIQAAEITVHSGANAVLPGDVGPGIQVAQNLENMTVRGGGELFGSYAVDWTQHPNGGRLGR